MAAKNNDPFQARTTDDANDNLARRRAAPLDNELQPDPELAEGRASGGRIALFAIAIVAILGAVFYGLNNPSIAPQPESTAQTTTTPPANTATAPTSAPAPGQTTGSATTTPTTPPTAPRSGDNASGSGTSSTPSTNPAPNPAMTPAPSPSNGGTTQSGPPANN